MPTGESIHCSYCGASLSHAAQVAYSPAGFPFCPGCLPRPTVTPSPTAALDGALHTAIALNDLSRRVSAIEQRLSDHE